MNNNSSKTSKTKSSGIITSMTSTLPSRRIDINNIGRQSIRAVKNYLKMKRVTDIVDMTIALGSEETGLRMPKAQQAKEKKVLKYWANEINNIMDYNREQKKERDKIERAKKTALKKQENKFIKSVIDFTKNKNISTKTFPLPKASVMEKLLRKLIKSKSLLLLKIGNLQYTMNTEFIKKMINNIASGNYLIEVNNSLGSDEIASYELMNADSFTLEILNSQITSKKKKGAFFKYKHNVKDLNLEKYQIFHNEEIKDCVDTKNKLKGLESCFIHSIETYFHNCDLYNKDIKSKISNAKSKMTSRTMTTQVLEQIAKELNVTLTIKNERDVKGNNKTRLSVKNKGCDIVIPLGLIDEHYFLIEKTEITQYALINHVDINHIDRWNEIYMKNGNNYKRSSNRFISSYDVISYMYENKESYLIDFSPDELLNYTYYDVSKDIDVYDNEPKEEPWYSKKIHVSKEMEDEKEERFKLDVNKTIIKCANGRTLDLGAGRKEFVCYFDFESTTDKEEHQAYLVSYQTIDMDSPKCIEGVNCGKKMLEEVSKLADYRPIRFIAHNVKYDFQFIHKYIYNVSKIQRGSMLINGSGNFIADDKHVVKCDFIDSYSFIATKLSAFPGMFKFEGEKEIMPYSLWNRENVKNKVIKITDTKKFCDQQTESLNIGKKVTDEMKNEYYESFINKAKSWNCIYDDHIDIIKYSKMYCNVDVEILKKGYETFKDWIWEVCELNLDKFLTLPSLAHTYMIKSGVYKGCNQIGESQLLFIQKCMVGGRTMTSENKKYNFTGNNKKELDDLDAVSLYPSAMDRLGGYLKGAPKVITNKTYDFLKSVDGYFVEIEITKVGVKRKFPLMSRITDDGIRLWTNDMIGHKIFVDKNSLEDLIEFQNVEFNIVKGYYYDEGRNKKIVKVINHLFETRLKMKKQKNPIQQVYKLLMNSAYGKTLLKPFTEDKKYIDNNEFEKYVVKHYDSIIRVQQLHNNSYEITRLSHINEHLNLAHIGVEVLSMSKRIMNELMCLADDIDVDIYYQDTDSTHTPVKDIPRLKDAYFKKYNRELEGNKMGQFNCDFESNILKGKVRSVESVFLGKKCYIDKLQGDEENVYDYHIRMKGVSGDAINDKIYNEFTNPIELYKSLFNGVAEKFDLCCSGKKACFENMTNGLMSTKHLFERIVKFQ